MVVNDVLSPAMHVKALTQGQQAVFRLLNANKREPGREELTTPEQYWMNAQEEVFDPIANRKVLIGSVKGFKQVLEHGRPKLGADGYPILTPELDRPKFDRGFLTLSFEEFEKYQFLMRSNKNKDNRFRSRTKGVKPVFELVDHKKFTMNELQLEDYKFAAQKLVRESEWIVLKAIREKLNSMTDVSLHITSAPDDLEGLKLNLIKLCNKNPKQLIMVSDDIGSKMIVTVHECENFGILSFEKDTKTWFYNDHKGEYKKLHTVSPDKTNVQSLIDFFQSGEGIESYQKVAQALKKLITATSK